MKENIKKISIIGGPGTGKSTLANNLENELNIPVYHIDAINYLENWNTRDKKQRDEIILNKINQSSWIMDGTYRSILKERVEQADLVIFLNYSKFARIKGILSRCLKNRGKEKTDIPGCKERMTFTFLKFTFNWEKNRIQLINKVLEKNAENKVIIFKNRKKLNKWYFENFKKKMKIL